ncbi:MAG: ABC transporter ATP-binding protein [Dehalococcoidia bacterium]|nr:ABC transporter ATP-binding protein [Dehalococcoidia bacterium]MXY71441.1 ABC transporter ATP-binding protein [Dehalococcoidia bacterium]MYD29948.1 ABC transporter ATP-binding protein [Dehalococcoidia bacterium]
MAEAVIEVRGLRKRYGELEAVRGIDLRIERGEVFALLGPNGAGKTTTVEILEGHRSRTAGEVSVLGFDPGRNEVALKERMGIVLQHTGLEPYLTVSETVDMFRGFYPRPLPLDEVLEVVGLEEQRDQRVRRLSGGQQRRLDVAVGLAGDPELLFLDEPTTGFDPTARRGAWAMIRSLRELGKTVLLTTHYLDEAQALADRVAIMVRGEIVAEDTPAGLVAADADAVIRFRAPQGTALPDGLGLREADEGLIEARTADPTRDLNALTSWALAEGVELEDLTVSRLSLEDVFLRLTDEGDGEVAS